MYCGKHDKKSGTKIRKSVALAVSLALLLVFGIGGTAAVLVAKDGPLQNLFTPSRVTTAVVEDFDGTTKSNVRIRNTGNTTAWIRAAVVVTWQDGSGNVYGRLPVKDTDYTITFAEGTGWLKGDDGFYYYTEPVKSVKEASVNCETGVLISACTYKANAPTGYTLCVEILSSGIQSRPVSVFNNNWSGSGLTASADKLTKGAGT